MKHLLKLQDLSREEIISILNLADQLKFERKNGILKDYCKGKKMGMIFEKSSTRTRVSFESGMYELGGHSLFLSSNDLQIGRGEPVQDTARVLSRYLDILMIRTFKQQEVEDFAKYGSIPVINGLTDYAHPCQVLADLMTIREIEGSFKDLKMAFIGDGNNMANSLIVGAIKLGMEFAIACPEGYEPDAQIVAWAKENGNFTLTRSVEEAMTGADVLYTDVWASMGMEKDKLQRQHDFAGYQINSDNIRCAEKDVMVMHCLPAHRGEEITDEVFEAHANEIFEEAENRLHAQKAVIIKLLK